MLGMMFGVGAVIAMLAIGAGAERQALLLIDKLGVRNIVVRAKDFKPEELAEVRKKSLGLSPRDVDAIREAVPGAELIVPRLQLDVYKILARYRKDRGEGLRRLAPARPAGDLPLEEGRFFDARDDETHAQSASSAAACGATCSAPSRHSGSDLKVNDVWCEVVGVLAPEAPGGHDAEGRLGRLHRARDLHAVTTATRKFEHDPLKSPLDEIVVRLSPGVSARQTEAIITGLLDRLHGGVVDYETVVPEALLEQSRQTQRLFNIVMGAIAGISLLVGGIGIMNIMLASVLEQTREIGVRRAVGARRRDIRFQFLVNAFTLSLLGGVAGVLVGIAIARIVSSYAGWPTAVTLASIALSTGVSATVGLVSGLYPAIRASRLNPIEALRYE